ncbi:MAG TPA: hypothetical protein EYP55_04590 [Anaerolineae bacterium]|nr:hypothetical protein [Anaerolineae bacterium]
MGIRANIIRLLGTIELERADGEWSETRWAVLDTGAPMCLLPLDAWEGSRVEILAEDHPLRGVVPKEECALPVQIGRLTLRLVDRMRTGKRLEVEAYLASTNKVPLVLGFHRCLDQYKVVFDHKRQCGLR